MNLSFKVMTDLTCSTPPRNAEFRPHKSFYAQSRKQAVKWPGAVSLRGGSFPLQGTKRRRQAAAFRRVDRVGDAGHAQRPVLICCATGNRSTVAAKILIDRGVQRVYNLRPGIAGWERENLPVVR